jgi:hypothetical protein
MCLERLVIPRLRSGTGFREIRFDFSVFLGCLCNQDRHAGVFGGGWLVAFADNHVMLCIALQSSLESHIKQRTE